MSDGADTKKPAATAPGIRFSDRLIGFAISIAPIVIIYFIARTIGRTFNVFVYCMGAFVALVSISRGIYRMFIQPQSRVVEWLATSFACGLAMLGVLEIARIYDFNPDAKPYVVGAAAFFTLLGSGWGWRCAHRLNEMRQAQRFKILASCWGGIWAAPALLVAPVLILQLILRYSIYRSPGETDAIKPQWVLYCVFALPLVFNAHRLGRRCEKYERENPRPENAIALSRSPANRLLRIITLPFTPIYWMTMILAYKRMKPFANRGPAQSAPIQLVEMSQLPKFIAEQFLRDDERLKALNVTGPYLVVAGDDQRLVHSAMWIDPLAHVCVYRIIEFLPRNNPPMTLMNSGSCSMQRSGRGVMVFSCETTHGVSPPKDIDLLDLPAHTPLESMLQLHRSRLSRLHPQDPGVPFESIEAAFAAPRIAAARIDEAQRKQGFYAAAAIGGNRVTWKGAIVFGLQSTFPWREILEWQNARRLQAELAHISGADFPGGASVSRSELPSPPTRPASPAS